MNNRNERENVTWTWSAFFWLKKLFLLGLIFLTAWLIWWLWNGFDGDTDVDLPAVPNPVETIEDAVDGGADTDAESEPTVVETPEPAAAGFTVTAQLERDGQTIEPTVDGCLHSYELAEGVVMTVADNCDDLRAEANDFSWSHTSNAQGTVIGAETPSAYCVAGTAGCSSQNGVLEFVSLSESTDADEGYVDVRIVSTAEGDEISTARATYGDIISSITVER